jgi:hypothetical protein
MSLAAVAQVVERSPEKAGVGGSTPSRGTILLNNLAVSTSRAVGTKRMIMEHRKPYSHLQSARLWLANYMRNERMKK